MRPSRSKAFVAAAEAVGLGCCPISVIRNHAEEVSGLLGLPDHLFPVAGLGVGIPATPAFVSARLPLGLTVHRDRYTDATDEKVRAYDKRRNGIFPYRAQRNVARFGEAKEYGWSEDKARQYAVPEREDFGAYVKRRGFRLEDCALSSSRGASEAVAQTSADRATIRSCLPDESILMLRSRTAGV